VLVPRANFIFFDFNYIFLRRKKYLSLKISYLLLSGKGNMNALKETFMAEFNYDIGILGGGAAGLTVASGAAQLGAKTILIEKEAALGGDCLHFGCVPSKTLIHSANLYYQIKNAHLFGLPKMQVPRVEFGPIAERIASVIARIQKHDSEERFCQLGAEVRFGTAVFSSDHTVELDGSSISAKAWVIATGSSPVVPPITGLKETSHLTNRDIFTLKRLPDSMVILGAGPIGIEMAQAFNRLGVTVAVVDMASQILGKEDSDMAGQIQRVLSAEGVIFYLNTTIQEVSEKNDHKSVTLKKAEKVFKINADAILVAMGRSPNVTGLGLDQIGVIYDRFGVKVDQRLRTSQKHIFAAGDVNGGYQFTHAAGYEGGIVVSNAILHLPRKTNYTWLPWCTYTDPELASIGLNENTARKQGIEPEVWYEEFSANDRSLAEGHIRGCIKLLLDRKQKPLGVQILGPRAGDLMGEWVAALNAGVKLSTLAGAIHPYPTLVEINKRVAGDVFAPKIFSDPIRKGLKFFFNFKGRACTPETNQK
jgi:pyruvate/2-oxoglutarate dehydrogenase complex dihydrolipoamide dehydrogenase (E3) component